MNIDRTSKKLFITAALSGMRTTSGLLVTGLLVRQTPLNYFSTSRLVSFFYNKNVVTAIAVAAVGELIVDKLPATPDRTGAIGLSGRIIAAAVAGATLNSAADKKPLNGAVAGGLIALASTFAFYYLRKKMVRLTSAPDPLIGAAEDLLAITTGIALVNSNNGK